MAYLLHVGDYKINIRSEMGSGTFGKVYKGKHNTRSTDVAAKKIVLDGSRGRTKDFVMNEVDALTRVKHHPYILRLLDHTFLEEIDEDDNQIHELWLVTEYCHAGNLAQYHKTNDVPFCNKVRIGRQSTGAIAFLHDMDPSILHRDIKPSNLLIKREGGIDTGKIADFGLAQSSSKKTVFSTVGGSMQYMSPELFSSAPKYRKSIDVFSLGVLLGHLLKALHGEDLEDEDSECILFYTVQPILSNMLGTTAFVSKL